MIPAAVLVKGYWLEHGGATVGKRMEVLSQDMVLRRYDDMKLGYDTAPVHSVVGPALPTLHCEKEGDQWVVEGQTGYVTEDVTGSEKARNYLRSLHLYRGPFGFNPVTPIAMGAYHPLGNKVFSKAGVVIVLRSVTLNPGRGRTEESGWFSLIMTSREGLNAFFDGGFPVLQSHKNLATMSSNEGEEYVCELPLNQMLEYCAKVGLPVHISDQHFAIKSTGSSKSAFEVEFRSGAKDPIRCVPNAPIGEQMKAVEWIERLSYMRNRGLLIISGLTGKTELAVRKIKDHTIIPLEPKLNRYNVPF